MIDLLEGREIPPLVHTDTKILRKADLPISNQEKIREVH
jgi:ribose transport system substrate-binding protein